MLVKTYTYTDYSGNERKEDFYFNITEAEAIKLEMSENGGLTAKINRIIESQNMPEIIKLFEELIGVAYGVKSPDGREFMKSPEITRSFMQTEGYNKLFMDFMTKKGFAADFFNSLMPTKIPVAEVAEVTPITKDE